MPSASPQPRFAPAEQIGRFRVVSVLGKGSQGVVYLAEDTELGRQVAIKTLRGRVAPAGLLQEARTASQLRHFHIVPVYDVGEHQGLPYVVYEYVAGRSLKSVLAEHGAQPLSQAMQWASQVLDALGYAHERGIVHRDLTPANIQIASDGTARVMDFGIATVAGTRTDTAGGIWGTVGYLAPELLANGTVGAGTDIFALGLILHEILSGTPVVPAESAPAAMYFIAHQEFPRPSRHRAEVSPELDRVVMRALDKDPARRYQSAEEMRRELATLQGGDAAGTEAGDRQATFAFLLRRMKRRADFPAISQHISELGQKTADLERVSVEEVATTILKDYALTTKLLRLVNSPFYGQFSGQISTVSRAVVVLGFDQVRSAALTLLMFEHLGNDPQARELKESAGQAFLSGAIGRHLAEDLRLAAPEQAFICSMFHTLGRYLTNYYFPEEHGEIRRAMSHRGLDETAASRAVLGLSYEEIGIGVAREWNLPRDIIDTMRPLPAGRLEQARDAGETLHHLSGFSNELTAAIVSGAKGRSDSLRALSRRFESNFRLDEARLSAVVDSALGDMRSFARAAGLDFLRNGESYTQAADWLQGRTGSGDVHAPARPSPGSQPAPATDQPPPAENPDAGILLSIQEITQALVSDYRLNDLLVMIVETVFRGLGFSRVMLCIRDARNAEMVARFGLGKDVDILLKRFRFPLAGGRDHFTRAVRERKDIVCHQVGAERKDDEIPPWYRRLVSADLFVAYPVVVNNVCLGLIYADREGLDRPLRAAELSHINTLRNQAALAIRQRS